ncbi:hypothetical protein Bhyg_08351 [Pseudolycoriella hygida]|uniref:Uncharacterized protein n=1 Tax=Pseudolycoriella hygida TaxID=35572 RepID=A0A9Q0S4Q6_9DIPT|nr:hypothetical protein Bhyg_08351 [Pseudolycoriella hygida]
MSAVFGIRTSGIKSEMYCRNQYDLTDSKDHVSIIVNNNYLGVIIAEQR